MENKNNKNNNNDSVYLKADDQTLINEKCIKWIKKMNDCLEICIKSNGCNVKSGDTHKICKFNNIESYDKLNKYFE